MVKTTNTTTNNSNSPTQQVPLKPEAELHLLVGTAYGTGDKESPYGHTAVYIKLQGKTPISTLNKLFELNWRMTKHLI